MSGSTGGRPSFRIVATRDFSGLTSSACALARADAKAPFEVLDRGTAAPSSPPSRSKLIAPDFERFARMR